jgi:hypothetical protein
MLTARKPFIEAHRAALVDFLEDSLRITRWYLDPKNHDEITEIAARLTKQPADRFGWVFTKRDYYRDPNMLPNLDALQSNVEMTKEHHQCELRCPRALRSQPDLGGGEAVAVKVRPRFAARVRARCR